MTDTMGSTPQPPRPQSGSQQAQPRFRLPESQQQSQQQPRPTSGLTPSWPTPSTPRPAADSATAGSSDAVTPPRGRYGEKSGMSKPRKFGLAVIGLVILGGVAGYIGWQQSHPTIQGTVTSFNVSSTSVVVTFEVDKPADKSATCTLDAKDVHDAVVGSAAVPILAGRAKNVQSYTLQTTSTANTVVLETCSLTS
jgi:hypothetical protein